MIEPKSTSTHRRGVTRYSAMLAITLALATVASPTVAMARGQATGLVAAVGIAIAPEATSGPLRIQVEPKLDDASLLPGWILKRNPDVAEKIPTVEGHEQWIAVEIGGSTYDYRVSVVAMRDGAPLGAVKEPETCECNSEKLLELVDARIAAVSEELRAAVPEPAKVAEPGQAAEPEQASEAGRRSEPSSNGSAVDDRHRRLGTMGYIGIAAGVLGAGALAAGIPLALRPDEFRGGPGTFSSYSTRPPGIGLAVGGGVALAAGIGLLVVDLVRHRKSSVAVLPTVGPRHAALSVTRRF